MTTQANHKTPAIGEPKSDVRAPLLSTYYPSPLGEMRMVADGEGLRGLWFVDAPWPGAERLADKASTKGSADDPHLRAACRWLDNYFQGLPLPPTPRLHPVGTEFQRLVWRLLLDIPMGQTTSYGALAHEVALRLRRSRMSAQAIGQAVGHNPIAIIVPCHRVVGTHGGLTGYAGGLWRKQNLLDHERQESRR